MKWKIVCEDFPKENQLCLCRKPYTYKEGFWYDYDYSICVYIGYEWLILETKTTCYLNDFTEWIGMADIEEAMSIKKESEK